MKLLLFSVVTLIGLAGIFDALIRMPSHTTISQVSGPTADDVGTIVPLTNDPKDDELPAESCLIGKLPDRAEELVERLKWLHCTLVYAFERSPGFGVNRGGIQPNYSDFFKVPTRHLPEFVVIKFGFEAESQRVQEQADDETLHGYAAWNWLDLMRGMTKAGFVYDENDLLFKPLDPSDSSIEEENRQRWIVGIPVVRESIDRATDRLHFHSTAAYDPLDRLWKAELMQLVSLLKHNPPVAYKNNLERRKQSHLFVDTVAHARLLNDFEESSLTRLRAGAERVIGWDQEGDCLTMVGAIRAKESCVKCHEEKQTGDLLGAFTYRIKEEKKFE